MISLKLGQRLAWLHVVFVVTPLLLLYVHGKSDGRDSALARVIVQITAPAQEFFANSVADFGGWVQGRLLLVDVEERNQKLLKENESLRLNLRLTERSLNAAEQRSQLCGFRFSRSDLDLIAARVVAQDLGPMNQILRLAVEVPEEDMGIPADASVITPRGLIGRVARVAGRFAEVEVLTDTKARAHARAGERGVLGTVRGVGPGDRFGLRFETTEGQAQLKEGDAVVTSGHDRRFVAGLVIGVIASDEARQQGVYLEYKVRPAVPFWEARELLIVRGQTDGGAP